MSPRVLALRRCPHCAADLSRPTPRVCPRCGGSLQHRFLSIGCLTSAPPPAILLALAAAALAQARPHAGSARDAGPAAREAAPAGHERPAGPVQPIAKGSTHL
jgi:hypothetical protein